ncbi:cytochrome P450 18a1 [Parasteatoda tepidariorum]|uniref:cytochrome P450 18a1 n=1 Tax=Parasteatoda tepidariorum TaxID=114398 RepID=UPI00077FACE2|nr:cytochrome P450 18a1 [Parasteatoda tepidariorum]
MTLLDIALSTVFVSTAVVLVFSLGLVNVWKKNRKLPPGPWGLPFLGYYPFISGKLYKNFTPLAKKYGDVFSFRTVGGKLVVVINGPKSIKEVFVNRSDEFNGRPPDCNVLEWISNGLGLIQEEGQVWKEHRRFFLHTVKNYGFGKIELEEVIHEEIKTLLDDMRATRGDPTDFDIPMAYAVNSVISHVLFRRKHDKDFFPKLIDAFHHLLEIFSSHRFLLVGFVFRYIAIQFFSWSSEIRRARTFARKVYRDIIDDHIYNYDPNHLKDYVDSYLHHIEKLKQEGKLFNSSFTRDRLIAISMNMTMEGTETVSAAILCLLMRASGQPEEQKLVQKELDAVVGRDRLPSWQDRQNLPYFEAFIQELNRTGQSFYTTAQYSNYEDTTVNGYLIPKRSIIYANLWTINNDPVTFPEPEKFDVGRFLGKDGKKIKKEGPYPFGIGKRDCPGQSLAQMEAFLILAAIFQNFTLRPGNGNTTFRAIARSDPKTE